MDQTEFGVAISPSKPYAQSTISAYEDGERFPSRKAIRAMVALAKKYNYDLSVQTFYPD